ncbi:MAG TPA: hypothetical protein VJ464_01960, partial [Blastocatellia bacterium]|nr:hypothetical protein [Blastocatellia bacterium]
PQTMNRYAYVLNNPLALVDPTGHAPGIVENPDYYDDAEEQKRHAPPQMTLVFDAAAAAAVESGHGSYADYGIGPVFSEQMIVTADEQIDVGALGSALIDHINNTVIDPHKNDGDRMVEGLFIGVGKLDLFAASLGLGAGGAAAEEGAAEAADVCQEMIQVFRVEGNINTRILIGDAGEVGVQGENTLFLNFGDEARAAEFLAQRAGQNLEGAAIKSFQVPKTFLEEMQATAVPERLARQFLDRPFIVDAAKAANQFGLRTPQIERLRSVIVQGTGRVF